MIDALEQAIYDTVHAYRGRRGRRGALALAPRIGMNPGTLNNKAYPGHESQLSLRESIPLQLVAGDFRILDTYAAELNHHVIPRGDFDRTSDSELLDLYAKYHAQVGQAAGAVSQALADGRVTKAEVRRVRAEFLNAARANLEFVARLDAIAEDDDGDA